MSKTIFIGIDIDSQSFAVNAMDNDGKSCISKKQLSYSNNQPGCDNFCSFVQALASVTHSDYIQIALEATSLYGWHLLYHLYNFSLHVSFKIDLFLLNPKIIAQFKKAYLDLPKTDHIDAFVIADRLRFKRVPERFRVDLKYLPLQRLTRYRFHLMKSIVREKSYFLNNLFLKFSEFKSKQVFSNLFSSTALAVISEFFSTDDIVNMPIQELCQFLSKYSRNRFKNPFNIAKELKKIARSSYRLDKVLHVPVNIILASGIQNIRALKSQVKNIDKAIQRELKAFPNTLESIKGIGPVYTAGLIAEIQNIFRFKKQSSLARFACLAWKKKQSGKFVSQTTRLINAGNHFLKYYFCEAANSLKMHNPVFKTYYQKKYSEVPKYKHKRALVLTARKLVRVVFALLKSNQLYIPRAT